MLRQSSNVTTVDQANGIIIINCDCIGCEEEAEFEGEDNVVDFVAMSNMARRSGWRIFNKNGTWHHLCPKHARQDIKL